MDSFQLSQYASVSVTLLFLGAASWFDLKRREVPDKVWVAYAPIGLVLTAFRTYMEPSLILLTLVSIGLASLIGFGLVFFGLAGGADAKAMMCLGLTLPLPPEIGNPILGYVHPFYPVVVLITGYVCSLSVAVWMLSRNLIQTASRPSAMFQGLDNETRSRKALALVTGYPTTLEKLESTFYLYPMEKVIESPTGAHRALQIYSPIDVDRDRAVEDFKESLQKVGAPQVVWVTPGLPMLIFILFAVVITLLVGDPVFALIFHFMPH